MCVCAVYAMCVHVCCVCEKFINHGSCCIRQKKMKRADVRYVIDNVEIPVVSQYKYLGCVIDEHLELNDMVEEKAMAGNKALGAWFSR